MREEELNYPRFLGTIDMTRGPSDYPRPDPSVERALHVFDLSLELEGPEGGRLRGELDRRWWIFVGPNGGFLSSICLKALQSVVGEQRQPRSLNVHFPGRTTEGPVELEVQLDKEGRRFSFASGRMLQSGEVVSTFLGSFGGGFESISFDDASVPDVGAPESIAEISAPEGSIPEFSRNFEYRLAPGYGPFLNAERAEVLGWIRFRERRTVDALMIPTISDAFYPAIFAKLGGPADVPTLDLTVHFRSTLPLPYDWLLGRFKTDRVADGFLVEDGEMWSRDGTLVAQSRQLALARGI